MKDTLKDSKRVLKGFLERRKNIRKEMTKLGRFYDTIMIILAFILLVVLLVSSFSFGVYEMGFGVLILFFIIIIPFSIIETRIQKKATKKYKAKLREQRLKFCMYCGGKLESIQKFCPYCGRKFDKTVNLITQTTEIEKKLREEYIKKGKPLSEQKEIFNFSRRSNIKFMIICYICITLGYSVVFGIVSNDFALFLTFLIALLSIMTFFVLFIGFMLNSMFIYSRFLISAEDITLYIEKKIYFQVNWSEIEKIDIYRLRFHGHFLKINYANSYKIISLENISFPTKKQKELINTLFQFSDDLKDKISVMKTSAPIVDEVGKKDLYEEVYQFARAQRFVFHKTIQ